MISNKSTQVIEALPTANVAKPNVEAVINKHVAMQHDSQSEAIKFSTPDQRVPIIRKSRLSVVMKDVTTFRSEIVDANVTKFRRSMNLLYNELVTKLWRWDDVSSYRHSFTQILRSGIENIGVACQLARMHDYNQAVVKRFSKFFKSLKLDFNGFTLSSRCINQLTVFTCAAKLLGVETANTVNTAVIGIWNFGIQANVFRSLFNENHSATFNLSRVNVAKTNEKVVTRASLDGIEYLSENVNSFLNGMDLNRLHIPADTSWDLLAECVEVQVHVFEVAVKYKSTTHERQAIFNTRGEGSVIGYAVAEPLLVDAALVLGKEQRILAALMAVYGSSIITDNLLMSQWTRLFLAETMRVNALTYELCNVDMSLTINVKKADPAKLSAMPFTVANYAAAMPSEITVSDCVASVLFCGVPVGAEFRGFEAFDAYPSLQDIANWRRTKIEGYWDHFTEVAIMPGLVPDSTLRTPVQYADILYLMYSYCGDFTPILFTPLVFEEVKAFEAKRGFDIYTSEDSDWWGLFVDDRIYRSIKDEVSPFVAACKVSDSNYPRLFYCVKSSKEDEVTK